MLTPLILFKALSDPTRLTILLMLQHQKEICVCDLASSLGLSQPKVSRHLALLKEQQLVINFKRGKWVYYQLNTVLPKWTQQIVEQAYLVEQPHIQQLLNLCSTNNCKTTFN